jgi:phage terminase large subunit-like protein
VLTSDGRRLPTHGPEVCRWIEGNVRLGPGDYYGEPFRLTSYQRRWIHRLFEFYPDSGVYRYKRGLFGTAKGNGKTPFEAALGMACLAGPVAPRCGC